MENEITAHKAGKVSELPISVGASVATGDTLAVITARRRRLARPAALDRRRVRRWGGESACAQETRVPYLPPPPKPPPQSLRCPGVAAVQAA